jgi:hypothetical protein
MKTQIVPLVTVGWLGLCAADRADEKKDTPKTEAKGTLTLGEKKYTFANALAYVNPDSFGGKSVVVMLTEKPVDVDKLKQSFKKRGNDNDFSPKMDYVKLIFSDDKGKLTQFHFAGGGGGMARGGDKNINGEVTIKDGMAKGSAGTIKADTVNNKTFEFEVVFDVKLTKP